jgi:hypothetical protein
MSAADQLKQAANAILDQMRDRKAILQSEYDDLQSQLANKRVELDAQVDVLSSSYERVLNFRPMFDEKFLCPRCWVVNGKESEAVQQGDLVRCSACRQEFSVI